MSADSPNADSPNADPNADPNGRPRADEDRDLPPEQAARIQAWLDGDLPEELAAELEFELARDPELAARVEALDGIDRRLRRAARAESIRGPRRTAVAPAGRRPWRVTAWAAAAALLVTATVFFLRREAPEFENVTLARGFAVAEEWVEQVPELAGRGAPGIGLERGASKEVLGPAEFVARADEAERRVAATALGFADPELRAGWFVLPIALSAPRSVLVLGVGDDGVARRLFPEPDAPAASVVPASRVEAGTRILPGPRAVLRPSGDAVDYRPGFLVPLGTRELAVLVAIRARELTGDELTSLERELAAGRGADAAAQVFLRAGFSLTRLRVLAPE